ncbi:DUF5053 domain-containing protein [Arachidicoccus ginsenosidimutans]|uniref:DUF5053 domain-containing protein n=1 Tax=Arachidicoccus sp. BS20 TaxID=1850526 RepID=UPI0007F0803D|nr:DUF5053 domain-containing protein [Arachidicoccus sp. BS20]ANI89921.1 DUF5053 domain-containing protein [Arachidicoccus sp. BS20]
METKTAITAKSQLESILLDVSWARIARNYFSKSSSWIYNKLNGIDGNGGTGEFSETEKEKLKEALYDLADKIRNSADKFE